MERADRYIALSRSEPVGKKSDSSTPVESDRSGWERRKLAVGTHLHSSLKFFKGRNSPILSRQREQQ